MNDAPRARFLAAAIRACFKNRRSYTPGVDKLPFTKIFRDPGRADGIPGVGTSSPVPRRAKPLPGTKQLDFPTGEHQFGLEGVHPMQEVPQGRTAAVFGILAIACAVALIGVFWAANWPTRWGGESPLLSWSSIKLATFLLLGFAPVFTIMSRIVSDNRCRIGCLAPVVLGVGIFLSMAALAYLEKGT